MRSARARPRGREHGSGGDVWEGGGGGVGARRGERDERDSDGPCVEG